MRKKKPSLPLVSVVVPYFNHNKYINKCLNSVIQSDYKNIELIIINDGSTEKDSSNLNNWIKNNQEKIEITFSHRKNQGICTTLNELISKSKGKYIAILASDDYLLPNGISTKVNILESHNDFGICVSDAIVVNDDECILYESAIFGLHNGTRSDYLCQPEINHLIIKKWAIAGSTYLIRKDLYKLTGQYDEALIVEDWDFFLKACLHTKIYYLDNKGSAYRWHASNTASNKSKRKRIFNEMSSIATKNAPHFNSKQFLFLIYLGIVYKIRSWLAL